MDQNGKKPSKCHLQSDGHIVQSPVRSSLYFCCLTAARTLTLVQLGERVWWSVTWSDNAWGFTKTCCKDKFIHSEESCFAYESNPQTMWSSPWKMVNNFHFIENIFREKIQLVYKLLLNKWHIVFDNICPPIEERIFYLYMMTSSNGNMFRVTGPLCGKFTGDRWIPLTKASDAKLWCFLLSTSE